MSRLFRASAFLLTVALASCASANAAYPFPTQLPTQQVLSSDYQALHHDLSPLQKYHFRIMVPKGWKTLKVEIDAEPAPGDLADVAVFRQPGPWMTDSSQPINGEIAVNVVHLTASGALQSPEVWLDGILEQNAKGFTEIARRTSPSAAGPVPDVLIKYVSGNQTILSRMMAFRSGDDMMVITCSDTADEYKKNADAYNVAISTFRLDSADQKPLSSGSGAAVTQ